MMNLRRIPTRRRRLGLRALAGLAGAGAAIGAGAPAALATPTATVVANSAPAGLVQSTGNLYWTSNLRLLSLNGLRPVPTYQASVYRAAKSNVPGQEQLLYRETSGSPVQFGAITWEYAGGDVWNGYFVANYSGTDTSYIKMIRLDGGVERTVVQAPGYIGTNDLVTDGTYLYWADSAGIEQLNPNGNSVTTLAAAGGGLSGFGHVALDASRVFFSAVYTAGNGQPFDELRWTPKFGGSGTSTVAVGTTAPITAIDTLPSATNTEYFLGLADGAVEEGTFLNGITAVLENPETAVTVDSISYDASNGDVLWGLEGPGGYAVVAHGSTTTIVPADAPPLHIQGDAAAMYWGDLHLEKAPL